MSKAVGAPGTNGGVFIVVTVVIIVVVSVPISVQPIGDIIFKFLGKRENHREWI